MADDEIKGYIYANKKVYVFNPTVKEMALIQYAMKNEDTTMISHILESHALWFDTADEMLNFIKALNLKNGRFGVSVEKETTTSDLLVDSDVIYCDFLKNYPHKVKSMKDLQNMNWWEFNILITGIGTSLSDRVSIRATKPKNSEERASIREAKKSVFLSDNVYK